MLIVFEITHLQALDTGDKVLSRNIVFQKPTVRRYILCVYRVECVDWRSTSSISKKVIQP